MDRAAFTGVYEANFRRVYNYISYRIDNHADVEDLVSQVFMRAIERHQTFDPSRGTAEMWIISIARNAVIDYHRTRAKRRHANIDDVATVLASGEPPDELIVRREEHRRLMVALAALDDRERQAISLKYGAELKNREIARLMNLSASNIGVILFRSLLKLRKELSKEVQPCGKRIGAAN